jgi:hypothetical protein
VIPPESSLHLSSNVQNFSKCEEIAEQCVNVSCPRDESVQMSFPCPNPIQISFPDTLDSNEVLRNVGHMVQSCISDLSDNNENSSDFPNIIPENMNSMAQTFTSEVSNDVVLINDLSSNFENYFESSSKFVSKSVKCDQSVQTSESQNNPFFAAMYMKFRIHHGKIPLYEIVDEPSGKYSRMTQTIGPSMSEYLLEESCVKSTCSIFSDNFSKRCNEVNRKTKVNIISNLCDCK